MIQNQLYNLCHPEILASLPVTRSDNQIMGHVRGHETRVSSAESEQNSLDHADMAHKQAHLIKVKQLVYKTVE